MGIFNKLNMQFIKLFYVLAYSLIGLSIIMYIITALMIPNSEIIALYISNLFLIGSILYLYAENNVNKLNLAKLNYRVLNKKNKK